MRWLCFALLTALSVAPVGWAQSPAVGSAPVPVAAMPVGSEAVVEVQNSGPPTSGGLGLPPGAVVPVDVTAPLTVQPDVNVQVQHPVDPYTREPYRGYPITYPAHGRAIASMPGNMPGGTVHGGSSSVMPAGYSRMSACGDQGCGSPYQTGPCGLDDCCEPRVSPLLENLSLFFGLDGVKEPMDLGTSASFGTRLALNWGLPLVEDWGLGLQVGLGWNYERSALRVLPFITGVHDREQFFTTIGVFQRTSAGLNYGLAWDYRADNYLESVDTSQWRALISMDLGSNDEAGFVATWRNWSDRGSVFGLPVSYRPINQVVLFWRHVWENDIVTKLWGGIAEEHSRFNLLLPPEPHVRNPFVFGGQVFVPLSAKLALYGEANIITPNDTGVVTAMFGFAWYPGASAHNQARSRFAPMFPLANNTSFAVDVQP